ncbi:acetyltransferase [Nocardioides albidus]|uniref:Acetyltransferase n=1 Tax=Nocardioides albidus TaxID=1517589 RepID=A0A5C4W7U5_9ACTN|nr:acetyltransferase [Nocardioides albidus]TNM44163.1 acetyltransferase [Nocardioides albidus]
MTDQIVVVGAGGFGREVLDVVEAVNCSSGTKSWEVVGVLDDAPDDINMGRLASRGVRYLGGTSADVRLPAGCHYVVGIGNPRVRELVASRLNQAGLRPATLVHPTATIGVGTQVGAGTVICAGVRVTTNVRVGSHVHLNLNCTVGHDSTVDDFVSINPLASVSGDCAIESGVLIGVAGVVLNGIRVGKNATVGGAACVVKDVAAGVTVKGVPAR